MDKGFEIDLVSLQPGKVYEYDWQIDKSFFEERDNGDILASDVAVHLSVEKRHDAYVLEFDFEGEIEVACDRCLDPVSLPIDAQYDVMVRHGEEYDDSRDDLIVIPNGWSRMDVSAMIYDTLLLEIPLQCVHPEGECNEDMIKRINNN